MGSVVLVQIAPRKKAPVVPKESISLVAGEGIAGDHHARRGNRRQVLLMAEENSVALGVAPGAVRENIVTRGIDLHSIPPGAALEIGGAVLEVTMDCAPCPFMDSLRPGLQEESRGRRGMLAIVIRSGSIRVGDEVRLRESVPR